MKSALSRSELTIEMLPVAGMPSLTRYPPADAVNQVRSRERAALDIAVVALRRISGGGDTREAHRADDAKRALDKIAEIVRPPY